MKWPKTVPFKEKGRAVSSRQRTVSQINETMTKLHELLPHSPYSPDVTPSDFFLFSYLKRILAGKKFYRRWRGNRGNWGLFWQCWGYGSLEKGRKGKRVEETGGYHDSKGHSDIPRRVKADPKLSNSGDNSKIRRCKKGGLRGILELRKF